MEIVRYLLGILPSETVKAWLRNKGISVPLVIVAALALVLVGWCSAESSRKKLASWVGSLKKRWLRLLARVLRCPQVTVDYQEEGGNTDTQFILRNQSERTAFRVKIADIRHVLHTAIFDEVSEVRKGDPVSLYCDLVLQGSLLTAFRHRFSLLLRANENELASFGNHTLWLPVYIDYVDGHNRPFETECEIEFNYFSKRATTRFKEWGLKGTITRGESISLPPHADV